MAMTTGSINSKEEFCKIGNRECIDGLPERIFQVFTTFYAHTQSICFYLMSQIWHDETEQTIDSLRIHSKSVSQKLEFASRLQANMLEQQREGLKLQRHLIEHGTNLSHSLSESRQILFVLTSEFRNSTVEHTRLLGELFGRLRSLHNWFVGEYAFVNQIVYYIGCVTIILLLTTSERSSAARFILFGCTALKIFAEYLLTNLWFMYNNEIDNNSGGGGGGDDVKINLFCYVWLLRKCFAAAMIMIYIRILWFYIDKDTLKMTTIMQISRQNEEILELLKKSQYTSSTESPNVSTLNSTTFRPRIRKRSEEIATESTEDLIGGHNKVDVFSREGSTFSTVSSSRYPIRLRKKTKLG